MEEKINRLKEKLQYIDTRELLGMIGTKFLTFSSNMQDIAEQSDIFNKTDLMSPQKQYIYLAGLLMSTADNSNDTTNYDEDFLVELEKLIQDITFEYIENFIKVDEYIDSKDNEDIKRNLVSMEAFTSFFDTGILRYPEQTITLIRKLYSLFDKELNEINGLSTEDYIAFYQLIEDVYSDAMGASKQAVTGLQKFLNSLNPHAKDIEKEFERLMEYAQGASRDEFQEAIEGLNTIRATRVYEVFGNEKGTTLLDIFGLYRKQREFSFYNEKNPFAESPLCWIGGGESLFIIHPHFLLNAIFEYITKILENPSNKFAEKYKKKKAEIVEEMFLNCMKDIFGDKAKYHTCVCEERGTKEHDILIEFDKYILIAEVKASKVREPLFNPEKAYIRVKDHFNSDTGIGGAYKQAILLKKFIENGNTVELYENKIEKFLIQEIRSKIIIPIVLTLNQFGGLAVNTSLLLEREDNQPYPWVCNWHDFENIIEIFKYLKKSCRDLVEYIVWRIETHSNILSSDELDVLDGYLLDKKVKDEAKKKNVLFAPNGPSLIDKIYYEKNGIPYHHPGIRETPRKSNKIGRNDKCPCGSGLKFKKCCIDKGIYD